jgi:HK97 family phage portal protein
MNLKEHIGAVAVKYVAKAFGISEALRLFISGNDMDNDGSAKPTNPYGQVSLVFTCVNKIINSVMGLPLVLSTIDEKIIESGPAYELLFNNPALPWSQFVTETIGNYALYRDVFWIFSDDPKKKIIVVPGNRMRALTVDGTVNGDLQAWEFRDYNGQLIIKSLDEVWHWKNFNPYSRHKGLGPATAAEQNINYTYAAELLNASALANGAELGVGLSVPGNLSPDQVNLLREQFESRQVGPCKARKPFVVTGGAKIENAASSMADLEVAKLTEMSDKKICSTLEVPPGIAGLITEAQYSHGPAMRDFIFNTIIPLTTLFADQITSGILNRFSSTKLLGGGFDAIDKSNAKFFSGYKNLPLATNKNFRSARTRAIAFQSKAFAWFDATQHPVVMEATQESSEKVLKLATYIPVNDIVAANDLPYQPTEAGKFVWKNMGDVPADYILAAGLEGLTGPALPEGTTPGEEPAKAVIPAQAGIHKDEIRDTSDEQRRLGIWRNWTNSWSGLEKQYASGLRIFFIDQQKQLVKKLHQVMAEVKSPALSKVEGASDEIRATSDLSSIAKATEDEIIARVVFDLKIEDDKIRVINQTFFQKASELGIRQVFNEVAGLSGDKLNAAVEAAKRSTWLRGKLLTSSQKITGINRTTQNMVASQLKQGLEAGETVADLAARLKKILPGTPQRAQSIARTSTAGAVGSGRHEGMKDAKVDKKGWLSSHDLEVRDAHKTADEKYAKGIDVNLPFIVDDEQLMFPGDPSGSAGNIINCRCVEIALMAGGKSFGLDYYSNVKFYSYQDMVKTA